MTNAAPGKSGKSLWLFAGVLIVVVLALVALAGFPADTRAEPDFSVSATPVADAFVDAMGGGIDDFDLFTQYQAPPADPVYQTYVIMKFDLNTATGSTAIERARLNVSSLACPSDVTRNVTVWGVNTSIDSWTEASLPTFAAVHAAKVSSLKSVDEGTVNGVVIDYYHWTDNDTGTSGLAEWLETQRQGDGVATLLLQLEGNDAQQGIWFGDREGSNAACSPPTASLGPPTLQLAGAGDPLAVTVSTFHAADSAPVNWPAYILGAVAIVLAGGALAFVLRRRTA